MNTPSNSGRSSGTRAQSRTLTPHGLRVAVGSALFLLFFSLFFAAFAETAPTEGQGVPLPADRWDPAHTRHLRNPFLPIGFRPPEASGTAGEAPPEEPVIAAPSDDDWETARATLALQGISRLGSGMAAIVSGRVVSVGDVVQAPHDGRLYRWRVQRLDLRAGMHLERLSATFPGEPIPPDERIP